MFAPSQVAQVAPEVVYREEAAREVVDLAEEVQEELMELLGFFWETLVRVGGWMGIDGACTRQELRTAHLKERRR